MPDVDINALGAGVKFGGIGKKQHYQHNQSYRIKLDPSREAIAGRPTLLKLKYEDATGVYPETVSVLVIVEKWTDEFSPGWFPFLLNLDWKLRVDIHGSDIAGTMQRWVAKTSKHNGWCFQIKGNFEPHWHLAKAALEDALKNRDEPSHVGLRVAAKAWREASQTAQGKGKGKEKED